MYNNKILSKSKNSEAGFGAKYLKNKTNIFT
jgi:hypothetical protein